MGAGLATRASSLAKSAAVGHVTRRTEPLGNASTRWAGVVSMRSRPTASTSFGPKTLSQKTSYTLVEPVLPVRRPISSEVGKPVNASSAKLWAEAWGTE